jgi:hypothetical protein
MLYALLAAALAVASGPAATTPSAAPPSPAFAPQSLTCVTHRKVDTTVHIHNGCPTAIWWAACVRQDPNGDELQFDGDMGIESGDDHDFTPAGADASYTYRLLSTNTTTRSLECFQ